MISINGECITLIGRSYEEEDVSTNTLREREVEGDLGRLRNLIIEHPGIVLEDPSVMRALTAAADSGNGGNIVDLRGVALDRLETRLNRLESTHRSVVAAAYENLSGMSRVHRAILRMLDSTGFDDFLRSLEGEVADILRVDCLRLVLEATPGTDDFSAEYPPEGLRIVESGFVARHMADGRNDAPRMAILRRTDLSAESIHGDRADSIRSEAALRLDFGEDRPPGMLAMGSKDPDHFRPGDGADLLIFFAAVLERAVRRWLA